MAATPDEPLTVRINAGFMLDAGRLATAEGFETISPPVVPLYDQVVACLDTRPAVNPWKARDFRLFAGVATTLVCVRWSTWLAVLADPARPLWQYAGDRAVSALSNAEMARINIEASSALEHWVDLFRLDRDRWEQLAAKALIHLPRVGRIPAPARTSPLRIVAHPGVPDLMRSLAASGLSTPRKPEGSRTRIFTNAAILVGYRNGPIEDIHAGLDEGLPLTHRRLSAADEAKIMEFSSAELAVAMDVVSEMGATAKSWDDAVAPFTVPFWAWSDARGWSTTERSRAILLRE